MYDVLKIRKITLFDTQLNARNGRAVWPSALLFCGLALIVWFFYEEVRWQLYVHDRWGRFSFRLDELKSFTLAVLAYFSLAGYFLQTRHQSGKINRTRMRLLRVLLLAASLLFMIVAVPACIFMIVELMSGKLDAGLWGLVIGLTAWLAVTVLIARAMLKSKR